MTTWRKHGGHLFIETPGGERTNRKNLVAGGKYLHKNHIFIREIVFLTEKDVIYRDNYSPIAKCGIPHFLRTCPTVATEEEVEFIMSKSSARSDTESEADIIAERANLLTMLVRSNTEEFLSAYLPNEKIEELATRVRSAIYIGLKGGVNEG